MKKTWIGYVRGPNNQQEYERIKKMKNRWDKYLGPLVKTMVFSTYKVRVVEVDFALDQTGEMIAVSMHIARSDEGYLPAVFEDYFEHHESYDDWILVHHFVIGAIKILDHIIDHRFKTLLETNPTDAT